MIKFYKSQESLYKAFTSFTKISRKNLKIEFDLNFIKNKVVAKTNDSITLSRQLELVKSEADSKEQQLKNNLITKVNFVFFEYFLI